MPSLEIFGLIMCCCCRWPADKMQTAITGGSFYKYFFNDLNNTIQIHVLFDCLYIFKTSVTGLTVEFSDVCWLFSGHVTYYAFCKNSQFLLEFALQIPSLVYVPWVPALHQVSLLKRALCFSKYVTEMPQNKSPVTLNPSTLFITRGDGPDNYDVQWNASFGTCFTDAES